MASELVVTDGERLEAFADSVTGEVSASRIDAALSYADPSRIPVEVLVADDFEVFGEDQEVDLADRAHDTLAPLEGDDARLLSRTIEIQGDDAHVALRIGTAEGTIDAQFRLVRRGDGWLVTRVRVL